MPTLHALVPSIGDLVAVAFWLGLALALRRAASRAGHFPDREHPAHPVHQDLPPGFRILPARPFDHERDL